MNNAQQELDDEILSACHDGELPPTEVEAVRRRLAREPELAERLEAMRYVDSAAAGALRAHDGTPVPQRILTLLERAEEEQSQRLESGSVVPLRRREAADGMCSRWLAAIKACVAFVAGRLRERHAAGKRR